MKDPASIASDVFQYGLSPIFREQGGKALAPELGPELVRRTRVLLARAGCFGDHHVQEVFSFAILRICSYLDHHSAAEVREPRAWFHKVFRSEVSRYLVNLDRSREGASAPLDGEGVVAMAEGAPVVNDEQVLRPVREAIQALALRFQRFLTLDLVEKLPPEEIRKAMGIQSPAYFKKLKSQAFSALRAELLRRGLGAV